MRPGPSQDLLALPGEVEACCAASLPAAMVAAGHGRLRLVSGTGRPDVGRLVPKLAPWSGDLRRTLRGRAERMAQAVPYGTAGRPWTVAGRNGLP